MSEINENMKVGSIQELMAMVTEPPTKEAVQDMVYPGTRKICDNCCDIGVVAFKTDEGYVQRVCDVEGCVGAERVAQESQAIVRLLDCISNYRTALLAVGTNRTVVNRHRNWLFEEADKFMASLR